MQRRPADAGAKNTEDFRHYVDQGFIDINNCAAGYIESVRVDPRCRRFATRSKLSFRDNFRNTFKELFGQAGQADLILVNEEDPLESGIEVIAKPPGKKPTSITLLSGGERSMTAVALLFSIYMVKPSPFCILDELDAPLDESNIGRFLKMLDKFIEKSQFVIVTHNKRTMRRADVLYGVTMEEFGVSKPVGMKLSAEVDRPRDQYVAPPEGFPSQNSHPELLEDLADFFIRNNYQLKPLIRQMLSSDAYQLSSRYEGEWQPVFVRYFAKFEPRRLSAEALYDSLVTATRTRLRQGELKAGDIAFSALTRPMELPADATPIDLAAWTVAARVVLNLDETLTKN